MLFVFIKAVFGGGHKLGNVDRMVVTHVSVDDPTVGISHRGTFPSPRHIRYLIEPGVYAYDRDGPRTSGSLSFPSTIT